jgi:TolA-binding protein
MFKHLFFSSMAFFPVKLSFISLLLLFSISIPVCFADEYGQLYQTKENICALISKGKLSEAKAETEKMTTKYASHEKLPGMLYWIALAYEQSSIFEDAKALYGRAANDFSYNLYTAKARLGLARVDAISLIASGKYEQAREVTDKMVYDFADNNDLPGTLYWIGRKYEQNSNFEEAKRVFQQVIQSRPDSQYANRARLSIRQAEAILLVISENYNQAQGVIDQMATDFAGNPDLPGTMFWITERFERQNRFEEAKNNYQRIIQNYPGHTYAKKANLCVSRTNVIALIVSGNYDGAKAAIDKMLVDFAQHPDLPGTLYWITEKYEWADKLDEAKYVYQQIIQKCPDSIYADRARLGIRRVDVMSVMDLPDGNVAEGALNQMIADFNSNSEMPRAVFIIGARYLLKARAPDYGQRAVKIVERVIQELPRTEAMAGMYAEVFCCAGDCHFATGNYAKALPYYKKVAEEYAGGSGMLTPLVLFKTGQVYEKLGESGLMDVSEAQTQTRLAYEEILRKYPTCKYADTAQMWLHQHENK